jgi:hypothetical protein
MKKKKEPKQFELSADDHGEITKDADRMAQKVWGQFQQIVNSEMDKKYGEKPNGKKTLLRNTTMAATGLRLFEVLSDCMFQLSGNKDEHNISGISSVLLKIVSDSHVRYADRQVNVSIQPGADK